ncbi:helix-turn-helix domain-containing protein [Serratia fonticola]|uniref:helix-turn-helix domain-containing protein n=1 Tax=Serratia fonticola TaxID=47917 RepID=UPI0021AD84FB|nr:LuxR C-terminal-related transcriptional regulator [Serratia fonticola]
MATHHIIVHHPCTFTRTAIKSIIASLMKNYSFHETVCLNALMQAGDQPPICKPELLITHISRCDSSCIDTLHAIEALQFQAKQTMKVLVLINVITGPLIMHFLKNHQRQFFWLDESNFFDTLLTKVNIILNKDDDVYEESFYLPNALTHRERFVMTCLIKGVPVCEIAHALKLHVKTISHHKVSALRKLGFRNINAMLSTKASANFLSGGTRRASN